MTIPNPDKFFKKALLKHGDTYDYTDSVYIKAQLPINIKCRIHGNFNQKANDHLNGAGCKLCANDNRKNTNLIKYGVQYPTQNQSVKTKTRDTNKSLYGGHPLQNDEIYNKVIQTRLSRYGVTHLLQNKEIYAKFISTCLGRYNAAHHKQQYTITIMNKISNYEYMYDQYITIGKTAQQIGKELKICDTTVGRYLRKLEIDIRKTHHSYISILWLDSIKEQENIYIQHNGNIGEYQIPGTRYKADGYCVETNTIYEFHGDYWHGNPKIYAPNIMNTLVNKPMCELYANTIERENQIISLGYKLVVIWESDWKNRVEIDSEYKNH